MVFQAALVCALHRVTGSGDVVIGTPHVTKPHAALWPEFGWTRQHAGAAHAAGGRRYVRGGVRAGARGHVAGVPAPGGAVRGGGRGAGGALVEPDAAVPGAAGDACLPGRPGVRGRGVPDRGSGGASGGGEVRPRDRRQSGASGVEISIEYAGATCSTRRRWCGWGTLWRSAAGCGFAPVPETAVRALPVLGGGGAGRGDRRASTRRLGGVSCGDGTVLDLFEAQVVAHAASHRGGRWGRMRRAIGHWPRRRAGWVGT